MEVSVRGVYYNQDKSPYKSIAYGLLFTFSSEAKKRQFESKVIREFDRFSNLHVKIRDYLKEDNINVHEVMKNIHVRAYKQVEPLWEIIEYE